MFRVRAEFREDLEIAASRKRVRSFFARLENFARLMPGVESIDGDEDAARWNVSVTVPLVGAMRGTFGVVRRDESPQRLEWGPAPVEKKNLLRYAMGFEEIGPERTLVRVAMRVELRRARATELHLMAPLIGEGRLSEGVEERIRLMMETFLQRSRAELEGG
ncbi:MAG TPA: SRPBCC family protein [Pyrinomonadaceae bacterium]